MFLPLKRYAQFSGRARRKEYWLYAPFVLVVSVLASVLDVMFGLGGEYSGMTSAGDGGLGAAFNVQGGMLTGIWGLANFVPSLAVSVRRPHDTDRSAWRILIGLIPLAGLIAGLVFLCTSGTRGQNRFGPDPKSAGTTVFGRG